MNGKRLFKIEIPKTIQINSSKRMLFTELKSKKFILKAMRGRMQSTKTSFSVEKNSKKAY